jgi:hypothetical protein
VKQKKRKEIIPMSCQSKTDAIAQSIGGAEEDEEEDER